MADPNEGDRDRRVASGFPDPEKVAGPTERLRELHGETEGGPKPPKYGRASATTAGSQDYVSMDDMLSGSGSFSEGAADRVAAFARRVGDEAAERIRAELDRQGVFENAKTAGLGIGQMGLASALGLGALGATGTAMIAGLSRFMPVWASALITAGAFGVPAGFLAADGLRRVNKSVAAIGVPASS